MIWLFLAQAASKAPEEIEDIRPPLTGPPDLWLVVLFGTLLVLAVLAYFLWPNPKAKVVQPPLPKEVARKRLAQAREKISSTDSYEFSVEVSDILRSFIEQQFGIKAVRQTTIEFLNEASNTSHFDLAYQERLRDFLVRCDAIKFARIAAGRTESEALFEQASGFVEEVK
jgi:hypothetical protein